MTTLEEMEVARQRMLAARKTLDDYRTRPGLPASATPYRTMSDELIQATNAYLELVGRFLQENSTEDRRVG
jgi:hypothetical protein